MELRSSQGIYNCRVVAFSADGAVDRDIPLSSLLIRSPLQLSRLRSRSHWYRYQGPITICARLRPRTIRGGIRFWFSYYKT
jgi:hypothetical protein